MGKLELEDDVSSEENDEGAEEEEEELYPPWLQKIVKEEYYDLVRVVKEDESDKSQPGYVRCKEIIVPDAADAADRRAEIRKYHLKKFSIVMIVSEPSAAPYVGLVEKIWRDRKAKPHGDVAGLYTTSDFKLECYWFYRPKEVPAEAWDTPGQPRRKDIPGAQFAWSKRSKPQMERKSERQLLFSSHHTLMDYPDQKGLLSLEGFLQICEPVHWIGLEDPPPEKYRIHGGHLIKVREPGFIVQGFLWCNRKDAYQFDNRDKRVYTLESDWGDKDTRDIVHYMVKRYKKRADRVAARNAEILEKYTRFRLKQRAGQAVSPLASDTGDDTEQQQQQRPQDPQQQQQQKSQQLPPPPPQRTAAGSAADRARGAPVGVPGGGLKPQGSGVLRPQGSAGLASHGAGSSRPAAAGGRLSGAGIGPEEGANGAKTQQRQQQPQAGSASAAKLSKQPSGSTQRDTVGTASGRGPQQQQQGAGSSKQAAAAARKHNDWAFGSDDDDD